MEEPPRLSLAAHRPHGANTWACPPLVWGMRARVTWLPWEVAAVKGTMPNCSKKSGRVATYGACLVYPLAVSRFDAVHPCRLPPPPCSHPPHVCLGKHFTPYCPPSSPPAHHHHGRPGAVRPAPPTWPGRSLLFPPPRRRRTRLRLRRRRGGGHVRVGVFFPPREADAGDGSGGFRAGGAAREDRSGGGGWAREGATRLLQRSAPLPRRWGG